MLTSKTSYMLSSHCLEWQQGRTGIRSCLTLQEAAATGVQMLIRIAEMVDSN
jgi:hypothetical protein